ncbi:MAG: CapA family protein [Bdellovibrionaceae bacterium]|nr:CapA family protein [Pseudobdellovibrionaceae bacterium]
MKKPLIHLLSFLLFLSSPVCADECPPLAGGLRVTASGDVLVHEAIYRPVISHPRRFKILWADLIPTIAAADFAVANLEGPTAPGLLSGGRAAADPGFVYDGRVYSGTNMIFNYHPFLLRDLQDSGFDLLTTANNHSLDRGGVGVDRTIEELLKIDMPFAGTRRRGSEDPAWREVTVKSQRLAVISCTEMTNGWPDPHRQVVACGGSEVLRAIETLKNRADAILIFPHWGAEYQLRPNSRQRAWAKEWIAAGAAAVIGNHPHVLQTVEWFRTSDGRQAPVIYSLGNFVAAQGAMEKRVSALAHLDFLPTPAGLEVAQFSYTPTHRPRGSVAHERLSLSRGGQALISYVEKQLGPKICRE